MVNGLNGLVLPFRVFSEAGDPTDVTARGASSRNSRLVQSSVPAEVPPVLVRRSHYAVGHFLGHVVFLQRTGATTLSDRPQPLVELRLPPEYCPTSPSQPPQQAGSSHGLSFPSALTDSAIHCSRSLPRFATVRPQGLVTLSTAYARRAPAGLVSCRRRSWDSPFGAFVLPEGIRRFPGRKDPRTVSPVSNPDSPKRIGPAQQAAVPGL
jgi:hypothetical protein